MGYRSEVVLAVSKEVMPQFLVTMAKSPETRLLCFQEHEEMIKDYQGKGNMLFRWTYIKWYESYEPIDALTDFMDWCDSEEIKDEEGEPKRTEDFYRFVRVGEDNSDIVERGHGFEIYTQTSVSY